MWFGLVHDCGSWGLLQIRGCGSCFFCRFRAVIPGVFCRFKAVVPGFCGSWDLLQVQVSLRLPVPSRAEIIETLLFRLKFYQFIAAQSGDFQVWQRSKEASPGFSCCPNVFAVGCCYLGVHYRHTEAAESSLLLRHGSGGSGIGRSPTASCASCLNIS